MSQSGHLGFKQWKGEPVVWFAPQCAVWQTFAVPGTDCILEGFPGSCEAPKDAHILHKKRALV